MGKLSKALSILAIASASVPSNFAQGPQANTPPRNRQKAPDSSVVSDGSGRPDAKAKTKTPYKSEADLESFFVSFLAYNAFFISSLITLNLFNRQLQPNRQHQVNTQFILAALALESQGKYFSTGAAASELPKPNPSISPKVNKYKIHADSSLKVENLSLSR